MQSDGVNPAESDALKEFGGFFHDGDIVKTLQRKGERLTDDYGVDGAQIVPGVGEPAVRGK